MQLSPDTILHYIIDIIDVNDIGVPSIRSGKSQDEVQERIENATNEGVAFTGERIKSERVSRICGKVEGILDKQNWRVYIPITINDLPDYSKLFLILSVLIPRGGEYSRV